MLPLLNVFYSTIQNDQLILAVEGFLKRLFMSIYKRFKAGTLKYPKIIFIIY